MNHSLTLPGIFVLAFAFFNVSAPSKAAQAGELPQNIQSLTIPASSAAPLQIRNTNGIISFEGPTFGIVGGTFDPRWWDFSNAGRSIQLHFHYDNSIQILITAYPSDQIRLDPSPSTILSYIKGVEENWLRTNRNGRFRLVEGFDTDFAPQGASGRVIRDRDGNIVGTIPRATIPRLLGYPYFQLTYEKVLTDNRREAVSRTRTTEWWSTAPDWLINIQFTTDSTDHNDLRSHFFNLIRSMSFIPNEARAEEPEFGRH